MHPLGELLGSVVNLNHFSQLESLILFEKQVPMTDVKAVVTEAWWGVGAGENHAVHLAACQVSSGKPASTSPVAHVLAAFLTRDLHQHILIF